MLCRKLVMYIQYSTQLRAMFANERLAKMLDVQQRLTDECAIAVDREYILDGHLSLLELACSLRP